MPRHTGQPVDYVAPLKGNVHIQTADGYRGLLGKCPCVLVAMCFCPGRNIVPMGWWQSAWRCTGVGCIGNLGIWQLRCWTAKVAVRQYRKRMQPEQYLHDGKQYFALDWGTAKSHCSAGALAGGAIVNLLFAAVGGYVREVSWDR